MCEQKNSIFFYSWIMFKRCLLISMRNPEALLMSTLTPFFLMLLFGTVFGNIVNAGDFNYNAGNFNYIDFIVPGIIMQSICIGSQHSAMNVAIDMTRGIIDRFRSMSIPKSAVIIGHAGAGMVRNIISTIVIFGTAFIFGFRPKASVTDWLIVVALLIMVDIAISLLAVMCGLIAKTPEGSSGLMFPLFILPFISSGFAPVSTMSGAIRWFAERQPMTPIIDSVRALTLQSSLGNSLWVATNWCGVIIVFAFAISVYIYKHKVS